MVGAGSPTSLTTTDKW